MRGGSEKYANLQFVVYQKNAMDSGDLLNSLLCDELLAEILCKIPDNLDQRSLSQVCKRWLLVHRFSKTRLGLCIPGDASFSSSCSSILSLLEQHPNVTFLSLISEGSSVNAEVLAIVVKAVALFCKSLRQLHFTAGPTPFSGLQELAKGCPYLTSLELYHLPTRCLPILGNFKALRELCLIDCLEDAVNDLLGTSYGSLQLERLCLVGMRSSACSLKWLWCSCRQLKRLELLGCEGIGDTDTSSFVHSLPSLREIQLRRCRSIAGAVLILISEHCPDLRSLTLHDGGDTEGLHHVLRRCQALQVIDLRLPLDLSNEDLVEIAQSCRSLRSLRLHSCWLATGAGMRSLASLLSSKLEELVLVRCRAVVQDSGTLYALAQNLRSLKDIDLSDNEYLADKELVAMLASCDNLFRLKLWRCCRLTDRVIDFISQRCPVLESIDIRNCDGISTKAVNNLLLGCGHLKKLGIELNKLTDTAREMALAKGITFMGTSCATGGRMNLASQNMYLELGSMGYTV